LPELTMLIADSFSDAYFYNTEYIMPEALRKIKNQKVKAK